MIVQNFDSKELNSARKSVRGSGLFLTPTRRGLEDLTLHTSLVATYDLPHRPHTEVHTILVLKEKRKDSSLCLEFFEWNVRTLGRWPAEPQRLMLPALQHAYGSLGLHFLFARSSLGLEVRDYKISHVLVAPTISDFVSLGLLESLFSSPVPTGFCTSRDTDQNGNPLYTVDYRKLLGGA